MPRSRSSSASARRPRKSSVCAARHDPAAARQARVVVRGCDVASASSSSSWSRPPSAAVRLRRTRVRLPCPSRGSCSPTRSSPSMTLLSTHTVYRGLLWSLGSWRSRWSSAGCSAGGSARLARSITSSAGSSRRATGAGTRADRGQQDASRGSGVKYYLLYGFLAAAADGQRHRRRSSTPSACWFAPSGLAVLPSAAQCAGSPRRRGRDAAVRARRGRRRRRAGFLAAHGVAEQAVLLSTTRGSSGRCFVAMLVLNRFVPRFWCRVLCPLGAFLGVLVALRALRHGEGPREVHRLQPVSRALPGGRLPAGRGEVAPGRVPHVPQLRERLPRGRHQVPLAAEPQEHGHRARHRPQDRARQPRRPGRAPPLRPHRRCRSTSTTTRGVIRPPGRRSPSSEFLERCIRCAECMKVCPNNALHPALFEAGIEGMWTPILIARIGYCEHSCVLCGQVCPTGAIQKITEEQKLGMGQKPISIGTAFYDQGRCLPWAMSTPCIVCEEFCPTSPKAIWVEEVDVPERLPVASAERRRRPRWRRCTCSGRTSTPRSASAAERARRRARCRTSRRSTSPAWARRAARPTSSCSRAGTTTGG